MVYYKKHENQWIWGYLYPTLRAPPVVPWISGSPGSPQAAVAIGTVREAVANGMAAEVQGPCVDLLQVRLATWQ